MKSPDKHKSKPDNDSLTRDLQREREREREREGPMVKKKDGPGPVMVSDNYGKIKNRIFGCFVS